MKNTRARLGRLAPTLTLLGLCASGPAWAQTPAAPDVAAAVAESSPEVLLKTAERLGSGRLSAWRLQGKTLVGVPPSVLGQPLVGAFRTPGRCRAPAGSRHDAAARDAKLRAIECSFEEPTPSPAARNGCSARPAGSKAI